MFYTTKELAGFLNYKYQKNFLQALHNNQKKEKDKRDIFFSEIWECRKRVGKSILFRKESIDNILKQEK